MNTEVEKLIPSDAGEEFVFNPPREKVEKIMNFCLEFTTMRLRKIKREEEAYKIAAGSRAGWATEKKYKGDDIFKSEDDGKDW